MILQLIDGGLPLISRYHTECFFGLYHKRVLYEEMVCDECNEWHRDSTGDFEKYCEIK